MASNFWKLEDAKARFSELVRRAGKGPQHVTVRGKDAAVVLSVEDYDRLSPAKPRAPFLAFMESLHLDGLDLSRDRDTGRDAPF